jgi:hypothetical protein
MHSADKAFRQILANDRDTASVERKSQRSDALKVLGLQKAISEIHLAA